MLLAEEGEGHCISRMSDSEDSIQNQRHHHHHRNYRDETVDDSEDVDRDDEDDEEEQEDSDGYSSSSNEEEYYTGSVKKTKQRAILPKKGETLQSFRESFQVSLLCYSVAVLLCSSSGAILLLFYVFYCYSIRFYFILCFIMLLH